MNQLLQKRTSSYLCYVLILALIMPAWLLALAATPAAAQTQHLTVGVIDFRNESGVQGEVLSRLATDAVALELAKQPTFDILSRAQVSLKMKELGLTLPLNKIGVSKLGQALTADAMVEGAIRSVQVKGTGGSRRAAVTLVVRMLDQASGEVINGGIQTGYSNPRVGYEGDDDTLVTEAIDNVAFLVVKTMAEYIIPEATVLNSVGEDQVMLNKGSRDGIKRGMRMIVKRDKEIIGYLQVANVDPTDSVATIVRSMRGVRAEDKVTAIFDMPAVSEVHADPASSSMGAPPAKKAGNKLTSGKNLLLALGAIAGIVALVNGGSGAENPGAATVRQTLYGVEVTWNPNRLWGGKNVLEAHIWRDDERNPVEAVPWGSGRALDDTINANEVKEVTYSAPNTDKTLEDGLVSEVDPLIPNRTYNYRFSAVYKINTTSGEEAASEYYETELVDAGRITFISPWEAGGGNLESPEENSEFNPAITKFVWRSRQGADRYVVQIATQPNFQGTSSDVWSNVNRPIQANPAMISGQRITMEVDTALRNWLASKAESEAWRTMYWRVGYANSTDTSFKGKIENYVFSEWKSFTLPGMPPNAP